MRFHTCNKSLLSEILYFIDLHYKHRGERLYPKDVLKDYGNFEDYENYVDFQSDINIMEWQILVEAQKRRGRFWYFFEHPRVEQNRVEQR